MTLSRVLRNIYISFLTDKCCIYFVKHFHYIRLHLWYRQEPKKSNCDINVTCICSSEIYILNLTELNQRTSTKPLSIRTVTSFTFMQITTIFPCFNHSLNLSWLKHIVLILDGNSEIGAHIRTQFLSVSLSVYAVMWIWIDFCGSGLGSTNLMNADPDPEQ